MTGTLVVVPTYNEAGTIAAVVEGVSRHGYELLIVDDGSPDGTADIAEAMAAPGVHVLRRRGKEGLGAAYRAGFAWALDRGTYAVVCQMDGDLSHDPADLPRLVAAVEGGRAALVLGSRYVSGGATVGWPWSRQLLSRGGNAYMRGITGIGIADMTSGFRAWDAAVIDELSLCSSASEGYSFQLEATARAWFGDKLLMEVPITFTERIEGESKMDRAIIVEALWRVPALAWNFRRRGGVVPVVPRAAQS